MTIKEKAEQLHKKVKKCIVPSLIFVMGIVLITLFYCFVFKSLSSREMFGIFNTPNHNYYLEIETDKKLSQFNFRRYLQINEIKYTFIHKPGKHKLRGVTNIFHCERNDDIDIITKMKNIFNEFRIIDDKNNIIWDLNDENSEIIRRMEAPLNIISWSISFE